MNPSITMKDVLEHPEVVARVLDRPVALLCDNGDKPREVALFAPLLHSGSILVAHDWGTEIGPADIPSCLTEILGNLCDQWGSASRVFRTTR